MGKSIEERKVQQITNVSLLYHKAGALTKNIEYIQFLSTHHHLIKKLMMKKSSDQKVEVLIAENEAQKMRKPSHLFQKEVMSTEKGVSIKISKKK